MDKNKTQITLAYHTSNALSSFMLGLYAVCLSWYMLSKSNNPTAVGWFYCTASLLSLLITPFFSNYLINDKYTIKIFRWVTVIRTSAFFIPSFLELNWLSAEVTVLCILIIAGLFGPSNTLFGSALDAMGMKDFSAEERLKISKRVSLVRQLSLTGGGLIAAGALAAQIMGITDLIAIGGLFSALAGLPFYKWPVSHHHAKSIDSGKLQNKVKFKVFQGFASLTQSPHLLPPALMFVLAFSASQMSASLLPSLMQSVGKSAGDYGLVSSSWGMGALAATLLLNLFPPKTNQNNIHSAWFLMVYGILGMVFCTLSHTMQLALTFAAMGASFALVRVLANAEVMYKSDASHIGQIQLAISNAVSLTALLVYLIPTLFNALDSNTLYAYSNALMALMACVILFLNRRRHTP